LISKEHFKRETSTGLNK